MSIQVAEDHRATRLRVARVATGLTMKEFAKIVGLNADRLCRAERGQIYLPPAWRPKLSQALGIPEQELVDSRGFPKLAD